MKDFAIAIISLIAAATVVAAGIYLHRYAYRSRHRDTTGPVARIIPLIYSDGSRRDVILYEVAA